MIIGKTTFDLSTIPSFALLSPIRERRQLINIIIKLFFDISTPDKVQSGNNARFSEYNGDKDRGGNAEKLSSQEEELEGYTCKITSTRNTNGNAQITREIVRCTGTNYKHGSDIKQTVETENVSAIPMPTRPPDPGATAIPDQQALYEFEIDVYREEIKEYVQRKIILSDNMGTLYLLVWGQYSQQMRAKVEVMAGYNNFKSQTNLIGLLKLIKAATFDFHTKRNQYHMLIDVKLALINFCQKVTMTNEEYHEKFCLCMRAVEEPLTWKRA